MGQTVGENDCMRRLMPWAFLGLLVLLAGGAAGLGVTGSPPAITLSPAAQWANGVLANTQAQGTAYFSYVVSGVALDGLITHVHGSGAINFRSDSSTVTEYLDLSGLTKLPGFSTGVEDNQNFQEDYEAIGRTLTETFSAAGAPGGSETLNLSSAGTTQDSLLGLLYSGNAGLALETLDGQRPVTKVQRVGRAVVNGVNTTKYRVSSILSCTGPSPVPVHVKVGPTFIWIDGKGRLVQVVDSVHVSGHLPQPKPGSSPLFYVRVPSSMRVKMKFFSFGSPVRISAASNHSGKALGTSQPETLCPS